MIYRVRNDLLWYENMAIGIAELICGTLLAVSLGQFSCRIDMNVIAYFTKKSISRKIKKKSI